MIKNYFTMAFRNIAASKGYSVINVTGLALGMSVAMLIALWLTDEISFDRNFKNYDRIAQVIQNVTNNGEVQTWRNVPLPLADELRTNYNSDFKHIVMAVNWNNHLLGIDKQKIKQSGGFFEKEAPEMLSMQMREGALKNFYDPSSIFLSVSAARACFGNKNPMGEMVNLDGKVALKVAGVYEDFPRNSSFYSLHFISNLDILYTVDPGFKTMEDPWRPNFVSLYVQLHENADFKTASARIKDAKLKKVNAQLAKKKPELFLHPMSEWHLYSEFKDGKNVGGAIQYVWMFGIVGVFVLLLACINFMNLATARSEKRAKEVGIRKTLGSMRKQLVAQFFSESIATVLLAFALSILFVQLALPWFNSVSGKQVGIPWQQVEFWALCLVFIFVTAVIAGSYPALYLSSFHPIKVLKGTFKAGRQAAIPRKILVALQFGVSVILIIGTLVVYMQIQFAKNRPIGYSRDHLIASYVMNASIHDHFDAVKNELIATGAVTSVAEAGSPTTGIWNSSSGFSWKGKDPNLSTDIDVVSTSHDYGEATEWEIKAGRSFSRQFSTDTTAVLLNEAAVHFMGLKDPVNETITWWGKPLTVIGVVKNMIITNPYDQIKPTAYTLLNEAGGVVLLRLNSAANMQQALAKIEPIFKKYNTEQPFEYQFVMEEYENKFSNEKRVGQLVSVFAILAIVISCLGLFGLTSFIAEQRKKEIGVRKVLGASILNVWHLLSKEFLTVVIVSFLVAVPLAYYCMYMWLQNFSYRTNLSWWIFGFACGASLLIAILTVSYQAIKAGTANPVKSLRTE